MSALLKTVLCKKMSLPLIKKLGTTDDLAVTDQIVPRAAPIMDKGDMALKYLSISEVYIRNTRDLHYLHRLTVKGTDRPDLKMTRPQDIDIKNDIYNLLIRDNHEISESLKCHGQHFKLSDTCFRLCCTKV